MSSSLPAPRYSVWQAVSAALAASLRALEEVRALSRQPGPQGERGAAGERGNDAFQLSELDMSSPDGGRTIVFTFKRGDLVETREIKTAIVMDCGVWRDGSYVKGDGVSWDGSFWIAQRDTSTKPGTPGSDWRMAVKRGQNGKAGEPGSPGAKGDKGDRGDRGFPGYAQ